MCFSTQSASSSVTHTRKLRNTLSPQEWLATTTCANSASHALHSDHGGCDLMCSLAWNAGRQDWSCCLSDTQEMTYPGFHRMASERSHAGLPLGR